MNLVKKVNEDTLMRWVDSLIGKQTVYGVQAKEDRFVFDTLEHPDDLRLDYDVTILPPKKYFQPQKEILLTFQKNGQFESVFNQESFILLGVHPYDMAAIRQMDQIFTRNQVDTHYMAYRDKATIVVSDVQHVSETVFAGCMGFATVDESGGFDILLTRLEDGHTLVDARTEKGEALLDAIAGEADASEADLEAREAVWAHNREALQQFKLKMKPEEIPALLDQSAEHPVWKEKGDLCYSCGSCNLVCPTCYCFDVQDEMNWDLESGTRYRTWDGCMLSSFAKVAGNHDFRPRRESRYRHRYMRKGKYVYDMIGEISCVGCGRCVSACTANIANPVEVFNRLLEDEHVDDDG